MSDNKINLKNRKKTRKLLFQKLYASSFAVQDNTEFDNSFYNDVFDFDIDIKYFEEMFSLIIEKEGYFLKIISMLAPKFNIENMSLPFVLPIYIGACEMLFLKEEIPAKVSINEAVEIAKVYGNDSTKKMVNGVLNKLYKDLNSIKKELENFDGDFGFNFLKR